MTHEAAVARISSGRSMDGQAKDVRPVTVLTLLISW
jgi:hypothetical protein